MPEPNIRGNPIVSDEKTDLHRRLVSLVAPTAADLDKARVDGWSVVTIAHMAESWITYFVRNEVSP